VPKIPKKSSRLERAAEELADLLMQALAKFPPEEQDRRIRKAEKTLADAKLHRRSGRRKVRK